MGGATSSRKINDLRYFHSPNIGVQIIDVSDINFDHLLYVIPISILCSTINVRLYPHDVSYMGVFQHSSHTIINLGCDIIDACEDYTVKPLIADPPKNGQPLYSTQIPCPRLILP